MKIQDIIFLITLVVILMGRKPKVFLWAAFACLILAIPLFSQWVFFTAERLTWYAASFILFYCLIFFRKLSKVK